MLRPEPFGRQDQEYGPNRQHHKHHDAQTAHGSLVDGRDLSEVASPDRASGGSRSWRRYRDGDARPVMRRFYRCPSPRARVKVFWK
jgi:hypothetical protein